MRSSIEAKMKLLTNKRYFALALLLAGLAVFTYRDYVGETKSIPLATALLVPDDVPLEGHYVQMWLAASQEDGIKLKTIHASQWVESVARYGNTWEGAILPDTFYRKASSSLVIALEKFVQHGGKLMVVYDGGTLNEKGTYPIGKTALTKLVGFDYAMYDSLRDETSQLGAIKGKNEFFEEIGFPPGRYVSQTGLPPATEASLHSSSSIDTSQVTGYSGIQKFSSFATKGEPNAGVLLRNEFGSIVASRNRTGKGETLFVNLPLTYLKQRSDSIFLHGFLRYFIKNILLHPQLSDVPRGRGAIVLNWHVDAKPALLAMQRLTEMGLFKTEGPFSFHVTAGPDVNSFDDKGGLDMDNNLQMRSLLKDLQSKGHAIASHGGWIHNYFGTHANEANADEMTILLEKNHDSITRLTGEKSREYSAPQGNQPLWVYQWLQDNGIVATYLTGNIGMGPTRLWMGEKRISNIWTFPVLTMGRVATAEDAFFQKMPQNVFDNWLQEVARFVEKSRTVRLIYFHPPGATLYPTAVSHFIERIAACRQQDKCNWLTMTQAADFMSKREQTDWSLEATETGWQISAQNTNGLQDLTWRVPKQRFMKPTIQQGDAVVEAYPEEWLIIAKIGTVLKIDINEIKEMK
jgi:hypothetical protein